MALDIVVGRQFMTNRTTGSRFGLGEPYSSLLADFCEANRGAPEIRIIRDAIKFFIEHELKTDEKVKERFEEARAKRLAATVSPVRAVPAGK
jgi:hypothetical protein